MIKKWWNEERIDRPEEGTSQDICPTNGDVVIYAFLCIAFWSMFAVLTIAAIM